MGGRVTLESKTENGLVPMEMILIIGFLFVIVSSALQKFWIEFKADFVIHWWIYLSFLIIFVSVSVWLYRKINYEPEVIYSAGSLSKYALDIRTPVQILEDSIKEAQAEEAKKIKKEVIVEVKEIEEERNLVVNDLESQREKIDINLDFDKNVYRYYSINKHERQALLEEGYEILRYRLMSSIGFEKYIVKPRFNESVIHFFTIYDIQTFLKSREIKTMVFMTKKPDLVFYVNGKSYAIEVETGTVLKRSKRQVLEKCKVMKRDYNFGFIVVPSRRMVRKYRKIVPVVDMRYLKNKLEKILKKNEY